MASNLARNGRQDQHGKIVSNRTNHFSPLEHSEPFEGSSSLRMALAIAFVNIWKDICKDEISRREPHDSEKNHAVDNPADWVWR